jgi:hypothetical protein
VYRKKNPVESSEGMKQNKANFKNKNKKGCRENYNFDETFNKTLESLKK